MINILKQGVVSSGNCLSTVAWGEELHVNLQVSVVHWACTFSWLLIWLFSLSTPLDTSSDSHNKLFDGLSQRMIRKQSRALCHYGTERSRFPLVWLTQNITCPSNFPPHHIRLLPAKHVEGFFFKKKLYWSKFTMWC